MPTRETAKQPSPKKTGLFLQLADGNVFELLEYPFPESREKFNVFVDGSRTQAARTQGEGSKGDLRNYTYIKHRGKSMYVATWIDVDAQVSTVDSSNSSRRLDAGTQLSANGVPKSFEEFIAREAAYRAWVVDHPHGFVLNARRNPKASYMVLHTARCHTVTQYRQHEGKDAFTGGDYIKVCADDAGALLTWMARYGAKNFSTLCSACKPDVSSIDQVAAEEAHLRAEARELMAAPAKLKQELASMSSEPPSYYYAQTKVFKRSPAVVAAVLLRAKGTCESCRASAPFLRAASKEPYLEVHHKVRLTDGGIDHPDNALALCPNCHREAHFG